MCQPPSDPSYFVSIDEKPAMASQPNLTSIGRKCIDLQMPLPPKKSGKGPPQKFGARKHQISDHFFATSALDTAYLRNETARHTVVLSQFCRLRDATVNQNIVQACDSVSSAVNEVQVSLRCRESTITATHNTDDTSIRDLIALRSCY